MTPHELMALAAAYLFIAAVTALPKDNFNFYGWFYDFLHALLPVAQGFLAKRNPPA